MQLHPSALPQEHDYTWLWALPVVCRRCVHMAQHAFYMDRQNGCRPVRLPLSHGGHPALFLNATLLRLPRAC